MIDKSNLVYRKKASGIVINGAGNFLLIQKHDYGEQHWDFPGGGIEEGETAEQTLLRELEEELGTNKFKILEKSTIKNQYEYPDFVIERDMKKGKNFRGQQVEQFIITFIGTDKDLKIEEREIRKYKWVSKEELESHMNFEGQWENIKLVIEKSKYLNE